MGEFEGTSFTMVGYFAFYWCTAISTSNTLYGCYLRLSSNEFNIDTYYRKCGFFIRLVIFPAGGYCYNAYLSDARTYGNCWTTKYNSSTPYNLIFSSSGASINNGDRYTGRPIRPIKQS